MKNSGICVCTFLGGALIGAAIALLTAPKSGDDTRRMIKDFVKREIDDVKRGIDNMACHCDDHKPSME